MLDENQPPVSNTETIAHLDDFLERTRKIINVEIPSYEDRKLITKAIESLIKERLAAFSAVDIRDQLMQKREWFEQHKALPQLLLELVIKIIRKRCKMSFTNKKVLKDWDCLIPIGGGKYIKLVKANVDQIEEKINAINRMQEKMDSAQRNADILEEVLREMELRGYDTAEEILRRADWLGE